MIGPGPPQPYILYLLHGHQLKEKCVRWEPISFQQMNQLLSLGLTNTCQSLPRFPQPGLLNGLNVATSRSLRMDPISLAVRSSWSSPYRSTKRRPHPREVEGSSAYAPMVDAPMGNRTCFASSLSTASLHYTHRPPLHGIAGCSVLHIGFESHCHPRTSYSPQNWPSSRFP